MHFANLLTHDRIIAAPVIHCVIPRKFAVYLCGSLAPLGQSPACLVAALLSYMFVIRSSA